MTFNIGRLLEERPSFAPEDSNLGGFFDLLMDIMKNPSLHVSIPALHLWVKLLNSDKISDSPALMALASDLLETCSQRLIRFEALPEDSKNPSIMFLNEDVDTMPEKHAFLGNYARFCNQVVEAVVQKQPIDALYHILSQADQVLDHVYDGEPAFQGVRIHSFTIFTLTPSSLKLCKNISPSSTYRRTILSHRSCIERLLDMAHDRSKKQQHSKFTPMKDCYLLNFSWGTSMKSCLQISERGVIGCWA